MHSRIIQIEKNPVDKDSFIVTEDIPEWFYNSVADYICESNREDDIEWLMESCFARVCRRDGDKLIFSEDISPYFKEKYNDFCETIKRLSEVSFNDFVEGRGTELNIMNLREAYNSGYSFYVYYDSELYTIDCWMRDIANSDKVFYIGGTLDFHM